MENYKSIDVAKELYQLGLAKLTGKGATKNLQAARSLFTRAALLDDSISMEFFGLLVRPDCRDKVFLMTVNSYRFAARKGCMLSLAKLGHSYMQGLGVTRNLVTALACMLYALRHGEQGISKLINELATMMSKRQIEQGRQLAHKWMSSGQLPPELLILLS